MPDGYGSWPLFERESGALVGAVLLKPLPEAEEIEVGWHLARAAWGNGYATESGKAAGPTQSATEIGASALPASHNI